ncbi:MAG: dihydrodipicolinate synthase family protein [Aggregatilineales bacterium]
MTNTITGIFNILATPFTMEQALDIPSLKTLVEFQIDKGAYGLTILGVLGEAAKLSVEERTLVMETVIQTVDRAHSGGRRYQPSRFANLHRPE